MAATAETVSLRRQLDKASAAKDEERMSDVLASLQGVEMTLSMLQESKIGASVSKLKKHTDERVSNRAKALIKAWKKVAEMSGVQGAAKMERPASSKGVSRGEGVMSTSSAAATAAAAAAVAAGAAAVAAGAAAGAAKAAVGAAAAAASPALKGALPDKAAHSGPGGALSRQISAPSGLSMDAEVDDILDETGIAPMRLKMRRKLFETLIMGSLDVDRIPAAVVAKDVECAMNGNSPYTGKKEDYLGKARQLVFNLKKNDQLRHDVRVRIVTAATLVVMSSNELMSKEKREAMDKAVSDRTEARMLDWNDKNQDKINQQCGIKDQQGLFECGRCKSTKTTYTQKQTRSADEPMTTFVTCSNCKKRWKFC